MWKKWYDIIRKKRKGFKRERSKNLVTNILLLISIATVNTLIILLRNALSEIEMQYPCQKYSSTFI
jgi:hypothetical protein